MDSGQRQSPVTPGSVIWVRSLLIVFGLYWLSLWLEVPLGWPAAKLSNGITYGDSFLSAVAMGFMVSLERTVAAVFAGILTTLVLTTRRSHWWALIIASLYALDYHDHAPWALPPTTWDHEWLLVGRLFPALACVVAAFVTAYIRRKRQAKRESSATHGAVTMSN